MKKAMVIIILFLIIFTISCQKQLSQEEALIVAHEFVNTNVKFFVNETENNVEKVNIDILEINKIKDEWHFVLHVYSNATGELKQTGMVVVVDAKQGTIKRDKVSQFKIEND